MLQRCWSSRGSTTGTCRDPTVGTPPESRPTEDQSLGAPEPSLFCIWEPLPCLNLNPIDGSPRCLASASTNALLYPSSRILQSLKSEMRWTTGTLQMDCRCFRRQRPGAWLALPFARFSTFSGLSATLQRREGCSGCCASTWRLCGSSWSSGSGPTRSHSSQTRSTHCLRARPSQSH